MTEVHVFARCPECEHRVEVMSALISTDDGSLDRAVQDLDGIGTDIACVQCGRMMGLELGDGTAVHEPPARLQRA